MASTGTKPTIADAIPGELKALPQWVAWRYEERKGKPTKVPVNPATGWNADASEPATWGTFEAATAAVERFGCDGVGFVFSEADDFFGIDLDACRNPETGELTDWAAEIVGSVRSYTEVSPSGYGVKIVARGRKREGSRFVKKRVDVPTFGDKKPEIAIYDRTRFWCLTGERLPSSETACEPRQSELDVLLSTLWGKDCPTIGQTSAAKDVKTVFKSSPAKDAEIVSESWFDRLLSDCAAANNGERSERDFALCAEACRRGCNPEDIWCRVAGVGKFAESGRRYFDATWQRASEAAASEPPKPRRKSKQKIKPQVTGAGNTLDLRDASARTDTANGRRFIARHGENFRHCGLWNKDLIFDSRRWLVDTELRADAMAKVIADAIWQSVGKLLPEVDNETANELVKFAKYSASGRGRFEMLKAARSEPGICIQPDALDADPYLFNMRNGTVDLRTGKLLPHNRGDYITKLCDQPFLVGAEAEAPYWEQAVETILGGKPKLVQFVRRLFGMSLVGEVVDHVLPILWGCGSNGKSLMIEMLLEAIGTDYADKGAADLLLATRGDRHPTEKADLFGKRLVVCVETEDNRRFAESTVKELCGGDRVKARKMREDFWSFKPSHTLMLVTNHKPVVKGTDNGIWRRLRLIPFTATFWDASKGESGPPELRADPRLKDKLRPELPGIVAWLVRGCLEWQAEGLGQPEEVTAATAEYRDAMDTLGAFLDECCIVAPGEPYGCKGKELRERYENWCKDNGEKPISGRRFGEHLVERGITKRTSNGTYYDGIALQG